MRYLFPLWITIIALVLSLPLRAQKSPAARPNIVIILADDMGYGDVSGLNPEARISTPHIDRLAQSGMVFTNAHASASVCTPSRYGILTGRYAWRSPSGRNVIDGYGQPVIEPGRPTIASVLKGAGYTTACIGKWHLGLNWSTTDGTGPARANAATGRSNVDYTAPVTSGPNSYGFDYSFILPASLDMPPYTFLRNHKAIDADMQHTSAVYPSRLPGTEYGWDRKYTGDGDVYWAKGVWWRGGEMARSFRVENCFTDVVDEAIRFMEVHAREHPTAPFFLYLPLTGPHTPWMPSETFKGKSPIGPYGDFILDVDHVVDRVTATLESLGLRDNTIVVFSSDNGAYQPREEAALSGHASNFGRRGQKGDIWDGGHRIPLIISWPGHFPGQKVYTHLVSLTDLYATFADLAGQKVQKGSGEDSYSFLSVLKGNTSKVTRAFMIHHSSANLFAISRGEWKLIDGLGSGGFTEPAHIKPVAGGPKGQLYHIATDSLETTNVYGQHPDIVRKLQNELNKQVDAKH